MILEILMITMVVGYNLHYSYPLSTYGEAIIILVQCYLIFFLAWHYKQLDNLKFFGGSVVALGMLGLYITDFMPEPIYVYNQLIILVLGRLELIHSCRGKSASSVE